MPETPGQMRIAVLSYTGLTNDQRVLRTIAALAEQGHEVTALAFGPAPAIDATFVPLPRPAGLALQRLSLALTHAPANLLPASAEPLHFLVPAHSEARRALIALRPDIVHANDAASLPAAMAAKRATGARVVYDSHEFATEEHLGNLQWRLVARRHVTELESRHIAAADRVITVSDGIADALRARYALSRRPQVVRSTPRYQAVPRHEAADPVRLLFHGILKPERGIEELIAAMRLLPGHVLTLRGSGAPGYLDGLRALAARHGVSTRVSFEPAVAPDQVVASAATHDVGIFCAPILSRQNRFAMPNKIFEYLMAGLAIVVADGTDLARLVGERGCGVVAGSATPDAIAEAILRLEPERLRACRDAARIAARELCWERESESLVRIYTELAGERVQLPRPSAA